MLNRLFAGARAPNAPSEADLRSHQLLHGPGLECSAPIAKPRIIIAQDMGDKAKVVLFDSAIPTGTVSQDNDATPRRAGQATAAGPRPSSSADKHNERKVEVMTELMFGTIPLSYRGTSVRVHPLQDGEDDGTRTFLFTKVFSVDVFVNEDLLASSQAPSGTASLSSSWGSNSGMREYPFPSMTPLHPTSEHGKQHAGAGHPASSRASSRDRPVQNHHQRSGSAASHGGTSSNVPGGRQSAASALGNGTRRQETSASTLRGPTALRSEVEAHLPFAGTDMTEGLDPEEAASLGWLPSPGPYLPHRRRSLETNGSLSPGVSSWAGSQASASTSGRCQPATCAVGILFSVPGTGQEAGECARLSRYWTMLTRAAYALQRTVFDQLTLHFARLAAQGPSAVHTPGSTRSRCRMAGPSQPQQQQQQRMESQIFLRGKKYYCALGQHSLALDRTITEAAAAFSERLAGGIELPDVVQNPLAQESAILLEEIAAVSNQLDTKECKFLFSTLLSHLAGHLKQARRQRTGLVHKDSLQHRFLIVSENPTLARRLLFCLARLLFRDHSMHIRTALDYALVWPANGILGVPRKDLIRRRESVAKQDRLNRGWDIPHARAESCSGYSLPLLSPSVFHRPPSTSSNGSSRNSSWKPSWTWFSNGSRSKVTEEQWMLTSSARSETRTMQTSWASSDFAQAAASAAAGAGGRALSPLASPRSASKSPHRHTHSEHSSESEDETTLCDPKTSAADVSRPTCTKQADGSVSVALLETVSILPPDCPVRVPPGPLASHAYPLTGFLSHFHPDMLLQAIPFSALDEQALKGYLAEEELYNAPSASATSELWRPQASIVLAEVGGAYRVRKMTRVTRLVQVLVPCVETDAVPMRTVRHEAEWREEVLTEVDEPLMAQVADVLSSKRPTEALAALIATLAR